MSPTTSGAKLGGSEWANLSYLGTRCPVFGSPIDAYFHTSLEVKFMIPDEPQLTNAVKPAIYGIIIPAECTEDTTKSFLPTALTESPLM